MKNYLLSTLAMGMIAAGSSLSAQLADGTVAPDFTATDLNGNSHTLSTYLNAGKTVIIDISATWCGPCWNYHNAHALREIYEAYGPDGSDEVMVFYVEGDGSTSLADLQGTGSNTQGDWVSGTPYPILDNAQIADDYAITYFPTIYRICPDGLVYEIGQLTTSEIVTNISSACGTTAVEGVQNHASVEGSEIALCSSTASPEASFTNFGSNAITAAILTLKENGTPVGTAPFSGNVVQFASGTVTFPSMTLSQGSDYTVELTTVNGGAPHNASADNMGLVSANLSGLNITVNIHTDNYPSEISWALKNGSGTTVASGGPYQAGTDDQWGGGGPDANTTKSTDVTLPAGTDCYSIELYDGFGDGWSLGSTDHGVTIVSNSATVLDFILANDNFGSLLVRDAALKTDATSGVAEVQIDGLNLYPNPATDNIMVSFHAEAGDYEIALLDLSGRQLAGRVYADLSGVQAISIPVSNLAEGNYFVKVSFDGVSMLQKVIIR